MSNQYNPINRLNYLLIASICLGEALIMYVMPSFGLLSEVTEILLDVGLLMLITIPIVQWLVIRPMKHYVRDLATANHTIAVREDQMLATLNALAKAKDNETGSHIMRTQQYVGVLANRLKNTGLYPEILTEEHVQTLIRAAPLHDLGKLGIPDHILNKPGRFTEDELELMHSHPLIGESILTASQAEGAKGELITTAIKVAGGHHEKWDGTGYPRRLRGDDIPIEARIMSVADVFDALVSDRPYKQGWSVERAYQEITSKSGIAFDPKVVEAFVAERKIFEEIASQH